MTGINKKEFLIKIGIFIGLVIAISVLKVITVNTFWRSGLYVKIDDQRIFLDFGVQDVITGNESNAAKAWRLVQGVGVVLVAFSTFLFWWYEEKKLERRKKRYAPAALFVV